MSDIPFPKNPYIIGVPLTGELGFYGRRETFTFIKNTLEAEQQNVVVLYGQRRVGKTSLLHQIARRFKDEGKLFPVYFDLQGRAQHNLGQVLYELARTIARPLKMGVAEQARFDDAGHFFREEFLPSLYTLLGKRRLLLLFDEFDVLGDELTSPESASETLFPYLQNLIMHERQIVFIFVVGRRIEELATHFQAIFKQAVYRRVGLLKPEDAKVLMVEPVKEVLTFEAGAIEAIFSLTAGHPYFTQLICFELFNAMKSNNQRHVAEADVLKLVDQAVESGHGALNWFWDGLPRAERFIMSAVARVTNEAGLASKEDIRRILEKHRIVLSGLELINAPDRLVEWEMLECVGPDHYRFVVELVRRWIIKVHPLESARRDVDFISQRAVQYYEIGSEAHRNGDLSHAEKAYRDALEANPNHSGAQLGLAQVLSERGKIEEAIEEFTKAYALDDLSARDGLINVLTKHGDTLAKEGKEVEAIKAYQQALAFSPPETESAAILTQKMESVNANWIRLLEIHPLFNEAVEAHQRRDWGAAAKRWQQLIQRGELKYQGHNLAALLSEAIEAQERLQQDQQALFEQGQQAQARQDWFAAEAAWQQLLDQGVETYQEQPIQPLLNQAQEMRLAQENQQQETEKAGKTTPRLSVSPLLIGGIIIIGAAITALIFSNRGPSSPSPNPTPTATNVTAEVAATLMPPLTTSRSPLLNQLALTSTPSATLDSAATAAFQATAVTKAVEAFKEDFSSNVNRWRVGQWSTEWSEQTGQFIDGKYRWTIEAKQGLVTDNSISALHAKDFRFSFEAVIITPPDNPANANLSIEFRKNKAGDFYRVRFNHDGAFRLNLWSSQKQEWKDILPQTSSAAFKLEPGKINRFTIQVVDTHFTLYANGQKLASVVDSTLREAGKLALAAGLNAGQKLTVDFDNLILEEIPLDKTNAAIERTATAIAAAPTATAIAYATAAAQRMVTFRDDFSSNQHGWPLGTPDSDRAYIKNEISQGKYHKLIQSKKDILDWEFVPDNFITKDFRFSVEVAFAELPEGHTDFSIIFRLNGDNYYRAEFNDDGSYNVRLIQDNQWRTIYLATTNNNAFNLAPDQTNTFALQVIGSRFTLYANNQELATVVDDTLSAAGQVGLGVGLDQANLTARVDFDNLIIEEIPLDQTLADIKSTATARANALATAQAAPTATVLAHNAAFDHAPELFREEFNSNTRGWQTNLSSNGKLEQGQVQFEEGRLRVSLTTKDKDGFSWLTIPGVWLKDFWLRVEATISQTSAARGDASLYIGFREMSAGDNYQAGFNNNNKYLILLQQGNTWQDIKKWTPSEAIKLEPGVTNTFEILAKEANLTIYANGRELYNAVPEIVLNEEGEIWLGIGLAKAGQTITVDFDNLIIKEVPRR